MTESIRDKSGIDKTKEEEKTKKEEQKLSGNKHLGNRREKEK